MYKLLLAASDIKSVNIECLFKMSPYDMCGAYYTASNIPKHQSSKFCFQQIKLHASMDVYKQA